MVTHTLIAEREVTYNNFQLGTLVLMFPQTHFAISTEERHINPVLFWHTLLNPQCNGIIGINNSKKNRGTGLRTLGVDEATFGLATQLFRYRVYKIKGKKHIICEIIIISHFFFYPTCTMNSCFVTKDLLIVHKIYCVILMISKLYDKERRKKTKKQLKEYMCAIEERRFDGDDNTPI